MYITWVLFFLLFMRYFYEKLDKGIPRYETRIELDHVAYKTGTLFFSHDKGVILVQKRFTAGYCYWDALDYWLANDIFLHPGFAEYVDKHGATDNYPIIPVRSAMWELRMKPLKKEPWEEFF